MLKQKNTDGPNERTDLNSRKRTKQLRASLSEAQFKTLVIKVLTEMVEYGRPIEEKVKAMQSEIKGNVQGTNSEWKERGPQINDLQQNPTGTE